MKLLILMGMLSALCATVFCGKLKVNGTRFYMDHKKVFLSGANIPYINYGLDFGDGRYSKNKAQFEKYIKLVHDNGGNSIRLLIHAEGIYNPALTAWAVTTGLDHNGTFINEFKEFLATAKKYNVFVFPILWNGHSIMSHHMLGNIIRETSKLQSYIDKALIPWVKAVKDEPALGGWDIMNEMERITHIGTHNVNPCFDTVFLKKANVGLESGPKYPVQELLRFINWQADAIRKTDPDALITAGSLNIIDETDKPNTHDIYSDKCLRFAGSKEMGVLTFYSAHSFSKNQKYDAYSPFNNKVAEYGFDRPLVIGEFSEVTGGGMKINEQFAWAYEHGYAGAWSYNLQGSGPDADPLQKQLIGIKSLRNRTDQTKGGVVAVQLT